MIFVNRHFCVSSDEMESWIRHEFDAIKGDGVESVELRRLASPMPFSESWTWLIEVDCRDEDAARNLLAHGDGLALIGDLRMLGMRPSVALVRDAR
jgi:hypothetical protein